jgi:hypothetical protein
VLQPGNPSGLYREDDQGDFLVLSGSFDGLPFA